MADKVNFGDELVSPEEKTRRVGDVFSTVARRYDLMNDLMSGGMHRLWKDRFVSRVKPRAGEAILDMAGGTGDVALRIAQRGAHVTVAGATADLPQVGKLVTDDEDSYRYLVQSIQRFPKPAAFKAMIAEAGFVRAAAEPMLGGLVTIHSGWKI